MVRINPIHSAFPWTKEHTELLIYYSQRRTFPSVDGVDMERVEGLNNKDMLM